MTVGLVIHKFHVFFLNKATTCPFARQLRDTVEWGEWGGGGGGGSDGWGLLGVLNSVKNMAE